MNEDRLWVQWTLWCLNTHILQQHADNHFYERMPPDGNRKRGTNRIVQNANGKRRDEIARNSNNNQEQSSNGRKRVVLCSRASHAVEVNHLSFGREYTHARARERTHTEHAKREQKRGAEEEEATAAEAEAEKEELTKNGAPKYNFMKEHFSRVLFRRVKTTCMRTRVCNIIVFIL